jgi:DNA repair ATPase RecN
MGNELKLSFENFQSISHGELIFHAGTNVIIGQSNSGKTATFRGLKACLSNPAGSQRFIKKGTSKSSVILEYNGNQIIWKRTPKESSYTINGEDYIKTGKSNAFKLVEDTGFVTDDNDVIMNIEEELQLPFPFGIPKSELFKLYENVFCVSDSAVILKAAKEKEESVKNEITTLENEVTKNKNKLEELDNFKKEVNIDFLKEKQNYLKENLTKINNLKDGLDVIHKALKVQGIKVEESSFENKVTNFKELKQLKREISKLKELHKVGKELKEIETPTSKDLNYFKELKNLNKICKQLKEIEDLDVPVKGFENKLQKYKELKEYSIALQNLKKKVKEKKANLESINELIKEKEEKLKEFKVCPLCHKPLD